MSNLPYGVEYAKSGRSSCKQCKSSIGKDSLRLSQRLQSAFFDGLQDNWFHFDCFFRRIKNAKIDMSLIRGVDWLKWEDQERLRKRIDEKGNSGNVESGPVIHFVADYAKSSRSKCVECNEEISKGTCKISSKKPVKHYHLDCILQKSVELHFNLETLQNLENLEREDVDKINAAVTSFEPIKRKAKASAAPDTKKRKKNDPLEKQAKLQWKLREELKEHVHKNDWKALLMDNNQNVPSGDEKILDRLIDCMMFGALLPCPNCKDGQITYSSSQQTYICTGNVNEWVKCDYQHDDPMRVAFKIDKDFTENEYLAKFKFDASLKRIYDIERRNALAEHKTSNTTSSMASVLTQNKKNKKSSAKSYKSVSGMSNKFMIKGGTAVDPDCEIADCSHVYKDKQGTLWSSVLGKFDLQNNSNSYYKLQLLECDGLKKYYLYRAWGRIGTTIGGTKCESMDSLDEAKNQFETLYIEKSGNDFSNHYSGFVKRPGKLYPIEVNVDEGESDADINNTGLNREESILTPAVQDLIAWIFDVQHMKMTMKEFEIDLNKMPLGKLSKKQIQSAYSLLTEATQFFGLRGQSARESKYKIIEVTNKFYTLIPHTFEEGQEFKLLNNQEIIKEKEQMLDALLDIEIAYNILKSDKNDKSSRNPLDVHYDKLNVELEAIDKTSDEHQMIVKYVKNTHGTTHNTKIEVEQVFKVNRHGESERYEKYANLNNRQLLWHGSRLSNYVGILSQGLRIAPPEAPVTGYMFGKGVYFADMVSKSANYCFSTQSNNQGLMLLSEVALGNMYELTQAKMITKLPDGYHSTKGLGQNVPNSKQFQTLDNGTIVPMGKQISSNVKDTSLLYNEYIVYDIDQINIKYLIKMKFL